VGLGAARPALPHLPRELCELRPAGRPHLAHEWGWALLDQRFRTSLESFASYAASWLAIRRHHGLADAAALYQRVLANADSPAEAHLIDV